MEEPAIEQMVDHLNEHLGEHQQILVHLVHKVDELEGNLAAVVEQLAMVSMHLFLQHLEVTEGGEDVEDNEIHEWGMAFIAQLDQEVQTNEYIKEHWMEGDFEHCEKWLKDKHPEITAEQWEWVEGFLSEI